MNNHIELAKSHLLAPTELSDSQLETVLGSMLGHAIDTAELYFQSTRYESWTLEDGIIKEGGFHVDQGVGVRALSEEKAGFAYSDDLLLPALQQAAGAAKTIAHSGGQNRVKIFQPHQVPKNLYSSQNPLPSLSANEKVALLKSVDKLARAMDHRVQRVIASMAGIYEIILVMSSDGTYAADVRPLVRLNVSVIAEEKGRIEQASFGGGGRGGYDMFTQNNLAERYAKEAVRSALVNLSAKPAPAGTMPVVLGPGWPGVLLHEAVGHGLEGDFNRKGSSAFSGKIGERVASPLCTVVDDGTLEGRRGSLNIDDEGTGTQCTTLIERGVLKGYMQDKLNAKLMKMQPTGNGRRESYAHLPMPRMTNTYMLAGEHSHDEIISSVKKGIYAAHFGGGQVDITSGKFVFNATEAYLIEDGKVTSPIKGATLIGNGPESLTKVTMVGNNLELDTGVGVCGKDGQSVPVGVGQPTMLISEMTVGGTQG